jgi:hypothetical protein
MYTISFFFLYCMCLEISNWATAHAFFNLYHSLFLRLDNFNYQLCYMVMNRETVICIFLVILLKLSCYYINDQEPNTWSKAHCLITQLLMTTWFNINHSFFFLLVSGCLNQDNMQCRASYRNSSYTLFTIIDMEYRYNTSVSDCIFSIRPHRYNLLACLIQDRSDFYDDLAKSSRKIQAL